MLQNSLIILLLQTRLYLPLHFDFRAWFSVKLKVQCGSTRRILLFIFPTGGNKDNVKYWLINITLSAFTYK